MSAPSFPEGDLDFESLNFDERFGEDKIEISHEKLPTKEDSALHQEANGATTDLSSMETKDTYEAQNVDNAQSDDIKFDEEDFQGVRVGLMSMGRTPEDYFTSSDGDPEQEDSVSGEDGEDEEDDTGTGEKPGDLLMSVCCGEQFHYDNKEDRIFAKGQPLAPQGAENPQVRNEEQGESESDEEVSYFGQVPERGRKKSIKGDGIEEDEEGREEEKQEDSSDSEREGMKVGREKKVLAQCFVQGVDSSYRGGPTTASLAFPVISVENLQYFTADVDAAVIGCEGGSDTGESDSYSSSDNEVYVSRRDEEPLDNTCLSNLGYNKKLEDTGLYSASSAVFSGRINSDIYLSKTAFNPSEDLLTTGDTDEAETCLPYVSQPHAQDISSYSEVQREDSKTTRPPYQGSLDDSLSLNTEPKASGVMELGQLEDKKRIKAFNEFYNVSDGENEREGEYR